MADDAPALHTNFADLSAGESSDLACSLATMILGDASKDFSADNYNALLKASKAKAGANYVASYVASAAAAPLASTRGPIFSWADRYMSAGNARCTAARAPRCGGICPSPRVSSRE